MPTILWIIIIAVLVIGAVYAGLGIKWKKTEGIREIICTNPNCGYRGEPCREKYFSVLVFLGLCLLWLLPGIIYAIVVPQYKYWCPECQMRLSV